VCKERKDYWAGQVESRLHCVSDLHAADAVYHQQCSVNFRTGKQIPQQFQTSDNTLQSSSGKPGRPEDAAQSTAFLSVVNYLEEYDDEQITIGDLINKMSVFLKENKSYSDPYSFRHMKRKLNDYFGNRIIIAEVCGKANVVTFRATASSILEKYYANTTRNENPEKEKIKLLDAAAALLNNDIRSAVASKSTYPACSEMSSPEECVDFLPDSLKYFLGSLIHRNNVEAIMASLGQAIMQAVRPKVIIAPLQLGLGVQMYHHFASRFLIDSLHRLGFCSSYYEIKKFQRGAAVTQGTQIPGYISGNFGQFVQYAADNVDHNVRTLDGNNTFHGMGMIAIVTPARVNCNRVPRLSATANDVTAVGRIDIRYCKSINNLQLQYTKFNLMEATDSTASLDILWKTSLLLRRPRPGWSGMMQAVHKGTIQAARQSYSFP